jgi:hypothetical protein
MPYVAEVELPLLKLAFIVNRITYCQIIKCIESGYEGYLITPGHG